jgi:hypothetical protein
VSLSASKISLRRPQTITHLLISSFRSQSHCLGPLTYSPFIHCTPGLKFLPILNIPILLNLLPCVCTSTIPAGALLFTISNNQNSLSHSISFFLLLRPSEGFTCVGKGFTMLLRGASIYVRFMALRRHGVCLSHFAAPGSAG